MLISQAANISIMIFARFDYYQIQRSLLKIIPILSVLQMRPFEQLVVQFFILFYIATIKHRRKSQNIKLDISVSSTPIKKDRFSNMDNQKLEAIVHDPSLVCFVILF